jgi:N-acyl-D-amino-acid deacylase
MTRAWLGAAFLALAAPVAALAQPAPDYDVLIRGGRVLDGTTMPWRLADVAIRGERIVAVGQVPPSATAARTVDARGRYVTPGFIDPHSHSIPGLTRAELAAAVPILHQGITTVVINPDGGGPADLAPQLAAIREHTPGVNVVPAIGHNGVRSAVMGHANRAPTADEMRRMEDLVRQAMALGAFGFTSGPFDVPGKYSTTAELVALAKVAAEFPGAFHASHVRDESNYDIGVVAAVQELIQVSREARLPGIVTHIKALGPSVWGKSREVIEVINAARAEGVEIWADQYPYAASSTGLQPALVPGWAREGGQQAMARRLQDPEQRALIRREMADNLTRRGGPNAIMILQYESDPSRQGKRLDEIARERLEDPLDTAIDMLIDSGGAPIVSFNMNEQDVEAFMQQPWTMTCTDGGLSEFGRRAEHPRAYGAFPRKIRRYSMDRGVVPLERVIHASTGLTATVLGIEDRGFLRPGAFADVVVFDPEAITDVATYPEPDAYSVGVEFVFVNGRAAVDEGKIVAERSGRILWPRR